MSWPDLRHVRYVVLSPQPPRAGGVAEQVLRSSALGAVSVGCADVMWQGRLHEVALGCVVGSVLGAAVGWARRMGGRRGFALVPWGVLVDEEESISAVRWSGVQAVDVRYRARADGSVFARVTVDTVHGRHIGFASDAVDLGALTSDLEQVAAASRRTLAVDLEGHQVVSDGEPFAERLLDGARNALVRLQPEHAWSYRDLATDATTEPQPASSSLLAALREEFAGRHAVVPDRSGLLAAIVGYGRLQGLAPELARLASAPHPGVAAIARAALARMHGHEPVASEDALGWFVAPDDLARLQAWVVGD